MTKLPELNWSLAAVAWGLGSLTMSVIASYVCALAWRALIIGSTPSTVSRKDAFVVFSISQFGKYLPGSLFQYIGRIAYANNIGLSAESATMSLIAEALLTVAVATLIGGIGIAFGFQIGNLSLDTGRLTWVVILGLIALTMVLLLARPRLMRSARKFLASIKLLNLIASLCYLIVGFGLVGLSLQAIAFGLLDPNTFKVSVWFCIWVFTVSWVSGFLSGAPAGFGVREFVMFSLFAPAVGEGHAMLLVLMSRILATLADFATGALCLVLNRLSRKDLTRILPR